MKNNYILKSLTNSSLILMILFLSSISANGQSDLWCATPEDVPEDPNVNYSKSTDLATLQNGIPTVFNIFYWQINDENGNSTAPLTEQNVLESVAFLNMEYNPINIFFKYRGFGEFDSPSGIQQVIYNNVCLPQETASGEPIPDPDGWMNLNRCQLSAMRNYASQNGYRKLDMLNVYVPSGVESFGGASYGIPSDRVVMPLSNINGRIMKHELGHALGLRHTHSGYSSQSGCERVTRIPSDPNYNADVAGDRVTDTAAVPNFLNEYCVENNLPNSDCHSDPLRYFYVDLDNCTYVGNGTDCDGTEYDIAEQDIRNTMAYTSGACAFEVTTGQGIRIQETAATSTVLAPLKTDISELYEPYKGVYYIGGPLIDPSERALFQPGFDYYFYPCDGNYPEPSHYDDISFGYTTPAIKTIFADEPDYSRIVHDNHSAFLIRHDAIPFQPRKCYNNTNRGPSTGGRVTRFNDNTFNYNTTTEQKNASQINNDQLINSLNPGLYKIEKDYSDGYKEEIIISKSDN